MYLSKIQISLFGSFFSVGCWWFGRKQLEPMLEKIGLNFSQGMFKCEISSIDPILLYFIYSIMHEH